MKKRMNAAIRNEINKIVKAGKGIAVGNVIDAVLCALKSKIPAGSQHLLTRNRVAGNISAMVSWSIITYKSGILY